jgi:hypothetical protein
LMLLDTGDLEAACLILLLASLFRELPTQRILLN